MSAASGGRGRDPSGGATRGGCEVQEERRMGGARARQGIVRAYALQALLRVTRGRVMTGSGNRGPSPGAACELPTEVADVTALFHARRAEKTGKPGHGGRGTSHTRPLFSPASDVCPPSTRPPHLCLVLAAPDLNH